MNTDNYVIKSLELHLFFGRIMKEHSFFLKAGFTPANPCFSDKAEFFIREFEKLLCRAVTLSDGVVGKSVLCSGEVVTDFTVLAEQQTEHFTGIPINKAITAKEYSALLEQCRKAKNRTMTADSLEETVNLREFKTAATKGIEQCKIRSIILPLLADHVLREANHYIRLLKC